MIKLSPDEYFNKKVAEYFKYYTKEIPILLKKSRKKALAIEKIRDELIQQRNFLYKFSINGEILSDSFRNHVVERFKETYEEYLNEPVKVFIEQELPEIRKEDEEDYNRYTNTNSKPQYDIQFLKTVKQKEIIELLASSCVLSQLWYQISDFLCAYYKDDKTSLNRILYSEFEIEPAFFKEQINLDFPDFRTSLNSIININKNKLAGTNNKRKTTSEPFILKMSEKALTAYLTKLYKYLTLYDLIDLELQEFIKHFTSTDFQKIIWKGQTIELVYLIQELNVRNTSLHSTTSKHFLNAKGQELTRNSLAVTKSQMVNGYPRIDKIMGEMKRNP
ncbi:MAG: hypothetical protein ABFS35_19125 [Bacteroidota bacterium]